VIRYRLPTVTTDDFTSAPPDPAHAYDAGYKGVLVTWAAQYMVASGRRITDRSFFGAG
jgi:hypothetical protein